MPSITGFYLSEASFMRKISHSVRETFRDSCAAEPEKRLFSRSFRKGMLFAKRLSKSFEIIALTN